MRLRGTISFKVAFWLCLCLGAAMSTSGCTSGLSPERTEVTEVTPLADVVEQAAAQATAIIQQARATALVLQAQSEATALVAQAGTPAPAESVQLLTASPTLAGAVTQSSGQLATVQATPGAGTSGAPEPATQTTTGPAVEIQRVTYGAEGAYIVVYFTATPEAAQTFWPGVLWVVDEASGAVYNEVPVMPIIGPLIARPREKGQPGYVMLVNAPVPLQPGALVTVVLGEYKFEHVPIQ
jgi:hypothetical protein